MNYYNRDGVSMKNQQMGVSRIGLPLFRWVSIPHCCCFTKGPTSTMPAIIARTFPKINMYH